MVKLVRFNDPFAGLTNLHSQLDDMFNNFLSTGTSPLTANAPAMDVYVEGDKQLVAEIQAPGFNRDDINISIHEGVLEIKGEHREKEEKDKKRSYMMRESQASFYRRIALPKHADGNRVEAHFEDGLLKVVVPFKELPQPKRIQIQAGKVKTSKK